jgi:hypothetical protein
MMILIVAVPVLSCFLPVVVLAHAASPAIKIMPLGDSITQWQCNNESQGEYVSLG